MNKMNLSKLALIIGFTLANNAFSQEMASEEDKMIDEILVIGKSVSYANTQASNEMMQQQSTLTSVLSMIDNLPGVLINEGDTFGSDDWSTTVSVRGFQLSLDEQQIGITIDGIANGNSNYGGGAKANRYIDTENLQGVEVAQGTADIASRSNEALGGSLNFTTLDPSQEQGLIFSSTIGDFDAQKFFVRYETGELSKDTYAWLSVSSSENSDWVQQSAQNTRDHIAGKIISTVGNVDITGYFSYDDTHEDNYQRVSLAQFKQNPEWDRLTEDWTGVPYIDQLYRRGWSTLRENLFGYIQAEYKTESWEFSGNLYYHDNEGRGDWVPPYIVDVTTDPDGEGHSELQSGNTVYGGAFLGQIFFVNANGESLAPTDGCESSITFPYGGAGPQYDAGCYPSSAIPVGSYRHTHYNKQRFGFNGDFAYHSDIGDMENTLRGGIWYEDYQREESRDWHKIIDSTTGYQFDHVAYWQQYDRAFPVETLMLYLEDSLDMGMVTARLGLKQFYVDLTRNDNLGGLPSVDVSSDSDLLVSAGVVVQTGIDGLEAFAGYAENFAAIKDTVLERDASQLSNIEPETAENIDIGLRYSSGSINANMTYYSIEFDDRLTFIAPDSPDGIDFLIGTNGGYVNVGGVESSGIEASLSYQATDTLSLYTSFTSNNSEYTSGSVGFPAGNTVFGSAEEMGVVSFDWEKQSYRAGLSTKWVGERWLDAANTQRVDSYIVSDFYASVKLENLAQGLDSMELRFTINNLFDESYLGGIAGQSAWIGAPRTAAFNATFDF